MYLKREESSRAFLPVWSVHLHRRFTPYNVHTLIECDARRSASVRCARLVGCGSPSDGSTPLFYRFSGGVLYARLPPRVWGLPRRPLRLVASRGSPPPRHVVCPLRRLPSLVGLRALAPVAVAAVAMVPRCTLGGTPQPLHIYHVLRSDTSTRCFVGSSLRRWGALTAPRTAPFWARLRPPAL